MCHSGNGVKHRELTYPMAAAAVVGMGVAWWAGWLPSVWPLLAALLVAAVAIEVGIIGWALLSRRSEDREAERVRARLARELADEHEEARRQALQAAPRQVEAAAPDPTALPALEAAPIRVESWVEPVDAVRADVRRAAD